MLIFAEIMNDVKFLTFLSVFVWKRVFYNYLNFWPLLENFIKLRNVYTQNMQNIVQHEYSLHHRMTLIFEKFLSVHAQDGVGDQT